MRRWAEFPGLMVPLGIGVSLVVGLFGLAIAEGDRAVIEVRQLRADIADSIDQMRREANALRVSADSSLVDTAARLDSLAALLDDQTRYLGGLGREAVRVGLTYEPSMSESVVGDAEGLVAIAEELRTRATSMKAPSSTGSAGVNLLESAGRVDALAARVRAFGQRLRQLDTRSR